MTDLPRQPHQHQHEPWQIRETPTGGHYCAACGVNTTHDGQNPHDPTAPTP